MAVTLIDLTEAEFQARRPELIRAYAQDVGSQFDMPPEQALAHAAQGVEVGLPAGPATPGQLMWRAVDGADEVGFLWISLPGTAFPDMAWISEIEVADGLRGRGYGSAMIAAGEADLVARGVHRIGLHVFGNNVGAQRLYARLGYRTFSQVRKRVATPRPAAVTLKPMTQQAYEERLADLATRDPYALARVPGADAEQARRTAGRIAPDGVRTEGTFLCTVHADGREAGWVWYALPNAGRPAMGLISHLEIAPAERRRGLGRETVAAVEADLATHGVPKIGVAVPGRAEAIGFADSLGMTLISQQMAKEI